MPARRDLRDAAGDLPGSTDRGTSIRAAEFGLPWVFIGRYLAPNGVKM
ncbi:MAG: hypothetical protein KF708_05525 [Pirellulales bacterium]|nr:hypothetical protein [Pirellulales bacterium]